MRKEDVDFKKLPDAPGVYFFRGPMRTERGKKRSDVLYVGRATSLRDRVRSYFAAGIVDIRSPLIEKIVKDAVSVEVEETDSVLEAIILEAKRIKELQPVGNTDQKDNKSFAYLVVTDEDFPRFLIVRERELSLKAPRSKLKALFGPFKSAALLKDALKIVRKIFPFFDTPFPLMSDVGRRTLSAARGKTMKFNQAIGLYPKEFDRKTYAKTVRNIILFFEGKKKKLLAVLEREMRWAACDERFEDAGALKRQLFALTHLQDVSLIREELKAPTTATFRIEAYDTAHIRGASPRGVMAVVENGEIKKSDYRLFTIRQKSLPVRRPTSHMTDVGRPSYRGDDYAALEEILTRRAQHREWPYPQLIVIDGGTAHLNRAKKILKDVGMGRVEVVSVVKDEKHRPREILGSSKAAITHEAAILLANSEAHRFAIGSHRRALRKEIRK